MEIVQISENLKAHFLRLYQMAICDENFSELELKMLYRFAEERGIPERNLDKILLNPIDTKNILPVEVSDKIDYLYDLTIMIWADNEVDENERTTLEKYIKMFGFVEENIVAIADYLLNAVKNQTPKSEIINEFLSN